MLHKTLWAFFRRDASIHTSYKVGFALELMGVFFSASTFFFVSRLFGSAASPALAKYGGNYFSFVLIGIAFSTYQNVGINSFSQSIRQEQFLNTLEPLLLTPVSVPQFLLGSALWDFANATLEVALYFLLGMAVFGLRFPRAELAPAFGVLALTLFAFMGLGIFSASFIMLFKRGNPVTWFIGTASELLGGVYFPVEILPRWLKPLSLLVPMSHSLKGLRESLINGGGWADVAPQLGALGLFIAVTWPLGALCFSLSLKKARTEGSLGHY